MAQTGTVKFFNATKGFGFITPDGGAKDVFVHISAVEKSGMRTLVDGQKVTLRRRAGPHGQGPEGGQPARRLRPPSLPARLPQVMRRRRGRPSGRRAFSSEGQRIPAAAAGVRHHRTTVGACLALTGRQAGFDYRGRQ